MALASHSHFLPQIRARAHTGVYPGGHNPSCHGEQHSEVTSFPSLSLLPMTSAYPTARDDIHANSDLVYVAAIQNTWLSLEHILILVFLFV